LRKHPYMSRFIPTLSSSRASSEPPQSSANRDAVLAQNTPPPDTPAVVRQGCDLHARVRFLRAQHGQRGGPPRAVPSVQGGRNIYLHRDEDTEFPSSSRRLRDTS
jgi:hypothetical protein